MATYYTGKAANCARLLTSVVLSSTDTTPIEILTATNHALDTGDLVDVYQHATNVAANGRWSVTRVDATHFTLDSSVSSGYGAGAGGYVKGLGVSPEATLSADAVDDDDAAAINTPVELLADRTQWGAARIPDVLVVQLGIADINNGVYGSAGAATLTCATSSVSAWTALLNGSSDPAWIDVDVQPGDVLICTFSGTFNNAVAAVAWFALMAQEHDYGVAASFASATKVPGSAILLAASSRVPGCMRARYVVAATHGKRVSVCPAVGAYGSIGAAHVYGDYTFSVEVLRLS